MKRTSLIITFIASILLLVGCRKNDEHFQQVTELLNISVPLELENIAKATELIENEKHFTSEQVTKLQQLLIQYVNVCADVQMSLMEENFGAAFNLPETERQTRIEQLNAQMRDFTRYGIIMYDSGRGIVASVKPTFIAQVFAHYISPSEIALSELSELEIEKPSQDNGFILVSYDEIATRLKLCDNMAARFADDELATQIEACRVYYVQLLTIGTDWNPARDYETSELNGDIRRVIEIYLDENPEGKSAAELHDFLETL